MVEDLIVFEIVWGGVRVCTLSLFGIGCGGGRGQKRAAKKVSKKKKLRGEVFRKVLSSSGSTLPVDGGAEEFPEIKADFFSSVQGRW